MADQKISQLTEKQTLGNDDLFVIATSNNNYNVKGSTIKSYAQDGLATVATTGSYADLSNTPTIPTKTSDLTNDSDFVDSTDLSTALEAKQNVIDASNKLDYAYLSNTPTIPTVNNATLTVTQNGTSAGTFTANASSDVTIAITETIQSASSPLSVTSNVLSIATADTNTSGALTSTDWNTFNGKAAIQTVTNDTSSTTATLALDANKLYTFETALTALTISSIPTGTYETEIQFTTDTGFTFTDNALTNKWLGVDAPTFEDGSSYVIAIKNGYGVCAKVGA